MISKLIERNIEREYPPKSRAQIKAEVEARHDQVGAAMAQRFSRRSVNLKAGAMLTREALEDRIPRRVNQPSQSPVDGARTNSQINVEFRRRSWAQIDRLLAYWRTIELWLKRAELINKMAVIPAINELRYAGRQLMNVMRVMNKETLSAGDRSAVERRITIAEQYLHNADHDIADALIGFYGSIVSELDIKIGAGAIAAIFPEYPMLRERLHRSANLIEEARGDYEKRAANYEQLRDLDIPFLTEIYQKLVDAEVTARLEEERVEREFGVAKARSRWSEWVGFAGATASIVFIFLGIYLVQARSEAMVAVICAIAVVTTIASLSISRIAVETTIDSTGDTGSQTALLDYRIALYVSNGLVLVCAGLLLSASDPGKVSGAALLIGLGLLWHAQQRFRYRQELVALLMSESETP